MVRAFLILPILAFVLITAPAGATLGAGSSTSTSVEADFNGDSFADLAVGAPQEDVGVTTSAGAVNVLYGTSTGLTASGDQFWHQGISGVAGDGVETSDFFGSALAAGRFNGDQFADLAVGVPFEDVGTTMDGGAVNVLYGSPTGLTTEGSQFWTQGSLGLPEADTDTEQGDRFGEALAAVDFGRSSEQDLAVGVPSEDLGATTNAGAVNLIYGSSTGLDPVEAGTGQFWHQATTGVAGGGAEESDEFGVSLAAANLGKSVQADLAVGAWAEDVGATGDAGAVNVLYGSSTGLSAAGDQFWHQGVAGVAGDGAEEADDFGQSLVAANLGKSVQADLAVGASFENVGTSLDAGAVNVLYGSSTGLTAVSDQFWHQGVAGVEGDGAEQGDRFGAAVAAVR
jgi:FG-GAP repeat